MTTPTGTITMLDIQNEFGGSNPIQLTEYYAGGANVPAGTAGVPSSGTIAMGDLRGKSKATPVNISVSNTSRSEGSFFIVNVSPTSTLYSVLYWKLTNYSNLTDADFNEVSGAMFYDTESNNYTAFAFRPITDTEFEGTGTFTITFYSDANRTQSVGQSVLLTVTDSYSTVAPTLSRDTIFRYANRNPAYRATVVSMSTSGLAGATVYYEIFPITNAYTVTSADIDAPTSLTGTLIVPSNGVAALTVRSTEWNGTNSITIDKTLFVRFRLGGPTGEVLGLSPAFVLYRQPQPSFSFSPNTVREGYASTFSGTITYIPLDGACSFFYTLNTSLGTATAADWIGPLGDPGVSSGELIWTSETLANQILAKIDTLSEPLESLVFTIRLNSTSGTAFWETILYIESPAVIIDASATATTVQINNVNSYPFSRDFTVTWRAKPSSAAGSSTAYSTVWNTAISGQNLTAGAYSMTAPAIGYTTNAANNNGRFDYQVRLNSSIGYQEYVINRTDVTQTFPVYSLLFSVTGTNASGSSRGVFAQITSTPAYPEQRNFVIEFRLKTPGAATWGAWTAGFSTTVNVPVNATLSTNTQIRPNTVAVAQYDVQLRCVLPWQEIRESNIINGVWL
jgi:hypothetical protein